MEEPIQKQYFWQRADFTSRQPMPDDLALTLLTLYTAEACYCQINAQQYALALATRQVLAVLAIYS